MGDCFFMTHLWFVFTAGSESPLAVKVDDDVKSEVMRIKGKFAQTIAKTASIMKEEEVSFEEFRMYSCTFLEIDFEKMEKVDTLWKLLLYLNGSYYCFINTDALQSIVVAHSHKAHTLVLTYAEELQFFLSRIKVHQFMKAVTAIADESEGTSMQPVILKLQSWWSDVTVADLRKLIKEVFAESGRALVNLDVKRGCVCCQWYAVATAVNSLTQEAQKKTTLLKDEGVLALIVGAELIMKNEEALKEVNCFQFNMEL